MALGSALAGGLLVAIVLAGRAVLSGDTRPANATRPTSAAVQASAQASRPPVGSQPTAAPGTPCAASPGPSASPNRGPAERAHIAHTDGQGVVLRASPNDRDWTPRGFMDGDSVTVTERQGADWARVRGDNGQEGWVPTRYLGP